MSRLLKVGYQMRAWIFSLLASALAMGSLGVAESQDVISVTQLTPDQRAKLVHLGRLQAGATGECAAVDPQLTDSVVSGPGDQWMPMSRAAAIPEITYRFQFKDAPSPMIFVDLTGREVAINFHGQFFVIQVSPPCQQWDRLQLKHLVGQPGVIEW